MDVCANLGFRVYTIRSHYRLFQNCAGMNFETIVIGLMKLYSDEKIAAAAEI